MTNDDPVRASYYLRSFAAGYGVDLETVAGSGEGGRLEVRDMLAAVKAKRQADYDAEMEPKREAEQVRREIEAQAGVTHSPASSRGAAWARNPLVDKVRAENSGQYRSRGPAPTLFASGDQPAFTASGIPASAVLDVPWQARHALAAAPSAAQAYAIVAECSGTDADVTVALRYSSHPGNEDYADRVQQWQLASMTDSALRNSDMPGAGEEIARREAALPLELPSDEATGLDTYLRHNVGGH